MRIAFAGTPAAAIPTLDALLQSQHEVVAIITQPPAAKGRSKELQQSEIANFAISKGIQVFEPESINSAEAVATLKSFQADIAVVVAYGQLLKTEALNVFPYGWVNAHFSLLPAWRGAAPVQAAIIHGDQVTGVTTFQLESGMDTGPIYGQVTTDIQAEETADILLNRLSLLAAELVVKTLDAIESGDARTQTQSDSDVTYAPKLLPNDGQINWHNPALAISRHIRGFTPSPGAWTSFNGVRFEIAPVEILESNELNPGEIRIEKSAVFVGTGSSNLKLSRVKPAGKSWMDAAAWARGLREKSGTFTNG